MTSRILGSIIERTYYVNPRKDKNGKFCNKPYITSDTKTIEWVNIVSDVNYHEAKDFVASRELKA